MLMMMMMKNVNRCGIVLSTTYMHIRSFAKLCNASSWSSLLGLTQSWYLAPLHVCDVKSRFDELYDCITCLCGRFDKLRGWFNNTRKVLGDLIWPRLCTARVNIHIWSSYSLHMIVQIHVWIFEYSLGCWYFKDLYWVTERYACVH